MVDRDGVEGAYDEHEVLPVGLLMRLGLDHDQSCEWVSVLNSYGGYSDIYFIIDRHK